jgi:hypothetical protein
MNKDPGKNGPEFLNLHATGELKRACDPDCTVRRDAPGITRQIPFRGPGDPNGRKLPFGSNNHFNYLE